MIKKEQLEEFAAFHKFPCIPLYDQHGASMLFANRDSRSRGFSLLSNPSPNKWARPTLCFIVLVFVFRSISNRSRWCIQSSISWSHANEQSQAKTTKEGEGGMKKNEKKRKEKNCKNTMLDILWSVIQYESQHFQLSGSFITMARCNLTFQRLCFQYIGKILCHIHHIISSDVMRCDVLLYDRFR